MTGRRQDMYRMPTVFGPATGPRRGPGGRTFDCVDNPKTTSLAVSFRTASDQLEALLPDGFELAGEPVVTVRASYMKEIEWLAGRGYNILGVTFPVTWRGERDTATGPFLTVLWENMTEPIITGREELGYAKIFCNLPEPKIAGAKASTTADWMGFEFMKLELHDLKVSAPAPAPAVDGTLHYKYMPRTGEWGTADVAYPVLTPAASPNTRIVENFAGAGTVTWSRPRWEDMPTQYNIVNGIADLEVNEWLGASLTRTVGGKDLSDQRILY